eukprot:c5334_g1_i1 orf=193-789(+)
MASLSTASLLTQEGPTGLLRGERKLCLSQTQASSSRAARLCRGEGELCVSAFTQKQVSSAQRRRMRLLRVAARRSSEKRKSVVEKPLPYEAEEDDGQDDEEYVRPQLPGDQPDFWEGPQFEVLGLIVQYLWAIGIVVALGGCFIAVKSYNEGAVDFKETEVYKEAMESQGFLEVPSDSKVFEEPPSQDAPTVEQESSS